MIREDYRLRIHDPGTTTPSAGTVDFVLDELAEVPNFGSLVIRPTEGKADLGRWTFKVVDHGGALTGNLADPATGRADLIGRIVEIQTAPDGSTWNTAGSGRLTAISMAADEPGAYHVTVDSERWVAQNAQPFTVADTAYLWPAALRYNWAGFLAPLRYAEAIVVDTNGGRTQLVVSSDWPMSTAIADWIRRDLDDEAVEDRSDGSGNFVHLRAEIDGVDREVITFGLLSGTAYTASLDRLDPSRRALVYMWVVGTLGPPANGSRYQVRLWAPTAPPSEVLPLHVGTWQLGGDSPHKFGRPNPWDLLEALCDDAGMQIDTAAVTALRDSLTYPRMGWRITDPETKLSDFVEEQIFAPLTVIPFLDNTGKVSPRSVALPEAPDFDPDTAFIFDADNLAEAPSWDHSATEVVNQISIETRSYREVGFGLASADGAIASPGRPSRLDFAADFLEEEEGVHGPVDYDSVTTGVGIRSKTYKAHGLPRGGLQWEISGFPRLQSVIDYLVRETFERFGDGPQWGEMRALRSPQDGSGRTPLTREPGELVILDLDTWPNLATGSRGGQRMVQLMSRQPGPDGVTFRFLDAGPRLQPLATPSVSLSANPGDPYHAVNVTVSGVPAGATATVELGIGASGPYPRKRVQVANGTITVSSLPSGSTIRARARATAPNRIRSAWSTVATTTTSTLPAPTGLEAVVDGALVLLTWSPAAAAAGYGLMPVYRVGASGPWISALERSLPGGSSAYTFGPLALSTAHQVGVRHVDEFGGLGTVALASITTGGTARSLSAPARPQVVQGRLGTEPDNLPPEALTIGYGVHVRFRPTELHARTVAEVATTSGFGIILQTVEVSAGVEDILIFTDGLDDTLRYVRLRHEKAGYTASAESALVTSKPTALLAVPGADRFPGGFVEVFERDGGKLEVFVQAGGDPDTESASYAWEKNPSPEAYPTVDASSRSVGPLPVRENLNQDDGDPPTEEVFATGDVVMIRVVFANSVVGFGQEFLIRHVYGETGTAVVSLDRLEWYNPTSGPFAINVARLTAHLRVPSTVQSYRSVLKVQTWDEGSESYDPEQTLTVDENGAPVVGVLSLDAPSGPGSPFGFLVKDRINAWDITFFDDVGGGAGAGSELATARIVESLLMGEGAYGQVALYATDGSGDKSVSTAIGFGADRSGDGVFEVTDGAIVRLRDVHDAGAVSGSWTPDYLEGAAQSVALSAATALQVPANWGTGRPMSLLVTTNGHALTFQASRFYAADGSLGTLTGVVLLSIELMATNFVVIAAVPNLGAV